MREHESMKPSQGMLDGFPYYRVEFLSPLLHEWYPSLMTKKKYKTRKEAQKVADGLQRDFDFEYRVIEEEV